ncbi:MAG: VOC family protein [Deltaproteobacteria bacterium]|jgi:methylmalonyl-CoA/ethylmalonyl-CoA epimerase
MVKDSMGKGPFNKLHHISIVVTDVEKTQKFYESIGIGPWVGYPPMKEYVKINVPDEEGFYNLKIKCAQIGPVQLQLIEPGDGESLYKDHLREKGEGVFHIGFEVDDISVTDAEIEAMGLKVLSSGRRKNGSGFSYLETASQAGVVLLVRQSPPAK